MTNLERETVRAIKAWCREQGYEPISVKHVYPRAYVLGRAGSQCLFVARPPIDARNPRNWSNAIMGADNSGSIHKFDKSLRAGNWCSTAYVIFAMSGEDVAIPAVPYPGR